MGIGNFTVSSTVKPEVLCEDDLCLVPSEMPSPLVSEDYIEFTSAHAARRLKAKRLRKQEFNRDLVRDFLQRHRFSHVHRPRCGLARFTEQMYPIHVAAMQGDSRMVRLLLSAGASLHQKTSRGRLPLDVAADADRFGSHQDAMDILRGGVNVMSVQDFVEVVVACGTASKPLTEC